MKIQRVFDKIWVGPGNDVEKICEKFMGDFTKDIGDLPITKPASGYAILNVADDYQEYAHPPEMLYIHAGLNDGPPDWDQPYGAPNLITQYFHAVHMLKVLVEGPWEVFVHCHSGVSRSAFVVACYIMYCMDCDLPQAMTMLKSVYSRANPHPKHDIKFARGVKKILESLR